MGHIWPAEAVSQDQIVLEYDIIQDMFPVQQPPARIGIMERWQEFQRQDGGQANPNGDEPMQRFDPGKERDKDDYEYCQEGGRMPDRRGQQKGEEQLDPPEVNILFIGRYHRAVRDDAKYRQWGEIIVIAFPEKGEPGYEKVTVCDQKQLKPH